MKKPIQILAAMLAVQILLAVILFATGRDTGAFVSEQKLIGLALEDIDGLRIEETGQTPLVVKKPGDAWVLPDHYGFPTSADKIRQVAGKLFALTQGWPVATTPDAAKHFKVDEEAYERKISFMKGDAVLKTLLLGSSPGFKKVHARVVGEDAVYAIDFSAYEASVKAEDWTDKGFLKVKERDVVRAELPGFTLVRKDGALAVEGIGDGEETDPEQAAELVRRLAGLNFQKVLGAEEKPQYKLDAPAFQFTLQTEGGDPVRYRFGKLEEKDDLVLNTSAHPYYFEVSRYAVESIEAFTREKLVRARKTEEEAANDPPQAEKPPAPPVKTPAR